MGAGTPNYRRLAELGKLPDSARNKIEGLKEIDDLKKQIEDIKSQMCEDCLERIFGIEKAEKKVDLDSTSTAMATDVPDINIKITANEEGSEKGFKGACLVEGCGYEVDGKTEANVKSYLRMHNKKHEVKNINKSEE